MRRVLLLVAFGWWSIVAATQQQSRAQSLSTVEGVVLEAGGDKPLERVRVSLMTERGFALTAPAPSAVESAVTDAQGGFRIEVKPGRYRVLPALEGFVPAQAVRVKTARDPGAWVEVLEEQHIRNLQLRMVREGVISGRVLDTNGQPPPLNSYSRVRPTSTVNITILQYRYDDYGKRKLEAIPGVSYNGSAGSFIWLDDRGAFRFYGLQPGDYYLRIWPTGALGAPRITYYPSGLDEAKAAPVHVTPGEEVDVGTMTIPSPGVKSVQVRFRFPSVEGASLTRELRFGNGEALITTPGFSPDASLGREMLVQMAPGHSDALTTIRPLNNYSMLLYARFSFDAAGSDIDVDAASLQPGAKLTTNSFIEDSTGRRPNPSAVQCRLRSETMLTNTCTGIVVPDFYRFELPPDMALLSAKAGDRDVRAGLQIDGDMQVEMVFGPGGVITGVAKDSKDRPIPDAVVALVPDAPLRDAGPLYRAGIADVKGSFELRAVAPGSYHLFAWSDLEGAAYRNAEFMKAFEDRGKPVRIEKDGRISLDVRLADEP